jgi:hypothetical protein
MTTEVGMATVVLIANWLFMDGDLGDTSFDAGNAFASGLMDEVQEEVRGD